VLTLGTAGHIDHGKSSLVKALTSIDPDRLPEEKARGMTIDLGFAWFALPSGENIGLVDVPGHRQFVHNVIPGLFGIDAALLVVAADDGWMPQTEEHLHILDLLGIKHGIVALNKCDLAAGQEWLDLVENDIAERIAGSGLAGSRIIRVSARNGDGIPELKNTIAELAQKLTPRQDTGKPRLPVDRVFVIKGSGVVVTGTLTGGTLAAGDEIFVIPSGVRAHVRSLESYKQAVPTAAPGVRAAVNLTGIKREDIKRGDVLVKSASYAPSSRIMDAELKLLADAAAPLKNMSEALVYLETRELTARAALIGGRTLEPGETGFVQLRFAEDVTAFTGERFIVRRPSPATTIGGGVILDTQAARFKLSGIPTRQAWLSERRSLETDVLILSELQKQPFTESAWLLRDSLFSQQEIDTHLKQLAAAGKIITAGAYSAAPSTWQAWSLQLLSAVADAHKADPLKGGTPQSAMQGRLKVPDGIFEGLVNELISAGKLTRQGDTLSLPSDKPALSPQQESVRNAILDLFRAAPTSPPTLKELCGRSPESKQITHYMIKQGELADMGEGIVMEAEQFGNIRDGIIAILRRDGRITIQDVNKLFGLSRKYSVPLLAHLDRLGVTRRDGDTRVAGKNI